MQYTFRQLTSRPDAQGRCRVLLDVTWDSQRAKLPTGVSCQPLHFDATAKLGRTIAKAEPGAVGLNTKLTGLVADLTDLFHVAQATRQPVTQEQVLAVASTRAAVAAAPPPPETVGLPFAKLLELWQQEHPHSPNPGRRYKQVVGHLETFHPRLTLRRFSKATFFEYLAYLHEQGMADSTVGQHVKFLRICFRVAEQHIPTWLVFKVKIGRAAALRREELVALARYDAATQPHLLREQQRLLFQTLLLLRDSDLRQLKPHHVSEQAIEGLPAGQLVLEFYQTKTGDEVRLPLPPLAAAIWRGWQGRVPLISQQKRNAYLKELAEAAGLTRTFVRVRFRGGKAEETPLPLWQVISTHTPRHTGADLVLWGSRGDQNLKEVALGHLAGASVYGYDTIERYGPLFLQAWEQVGALPALHPEKTDNVVQLPIHPDEVERVSS